jgi:hypothetical protein
MGETSEPSDLEGHTSPICQLTYTWDCILSLHGTRSTYADALCIMGPALRRRLSA